MHKLWEENLYLRANKLEFKCLKKSVFVVKTFVCSDNLKVYDPITFGFIHRNVVFGNQMKAPTFLITPVKYEKLRAKMYSECCKPP